MHEVYLHHATTKDGGEIIVFLDHEARGSELADWEPPGDWRWEKPIRVSRLGNLPLETTFISEL